MPQAIPFIIAATAVAGVGLQIAGTAAQAKAASSQNTYQQQVINEQRQQEVLRQQAMELDNQRRQREAVRQAQKARSLAIAAGANQNAFGNPGDQASGVAGGFGQISGAENVNLLGLSQSLALGRANFGISGNITNSRIGLAQAGADAAFGAGLSSLGGSLITAGPKIGAIGGAFGTGFGGTGAYNASQDSFLNSYDAGIR